MRGFLATAVLGTALFLGGCSDDVSWYLSINTYATEDSVLVGDGTGLYVAVSTNDGGTYLESGQWTVIVAPGPYSLVDRGNHADFYPYAAGIYVVRFDGWFQTSRGFLVARSEQVEIQALGMVVQ